MTIKEKIREEKSKYASSNWDVLQNPNEHDNAGDDFMAGADFALKVVIELLEERIKNIASESTDDQTDDFVLVGRQLELKHIINLLKSET